MKSNNQSRRGFIKTAGVAAAALTIPTEIFSTTTAMPAAPADKFPISYQLRLYSGILRVFDEFDTIPDPKAPSFKYDFSHPELKRLREKYQLDKAAGNGDEWTKTTNLLKWIKEHVGYRADITAALPEVCKNLQMNAFGLLDYSYKKGEDHGINCYMHSIVFMEACLSIGLKCRIISLNPMNPFDYDNHLVNIVWCSNFSKWVMADPSYNGYLADDKGMILNPWEIRDMFCRRKTITANKELLYNGVKDNSEDYLRYLAKNMVYMQSPTFSGFNSTTTSDKPWLVLVPKHFDVCKREAYNMKWRLEGDKGNWEKEELDKLLKKECYLVTTTSIASFAQKP